MNELQVYFVEDEEGLQGSAINVTEPRTTRGVGRRAHHRLRHRRA